MKEKYIELLLNRCLKVDSDSTLFINYNVINKDFVDELIEYAKKIGIKDIYLDEEDTNAIHEFLENNSLEEIKNSEYFNSSIWDEYAKKGSAFLMLNAEMPYVMDDIDSEKISLSAFIKRNTKPLYKERQLKGEIPWCIAALPNELWAKDIFPNSENPMEDFWHNLSKICMLDTKNPIESWNAFLNSQKESVKKLNELNIKKLHYSNSLGTNLTLTLPDEVLWCSAEEGNYIVNMPSYEIFTSPDYRYTEGIVYSTKPLLYSNRLIEDFWLKFKNGKVVDYDAKIGKDILKGIISTDDYSCFLGECALVNYNSPISESNIIFKSTLFDENASCHLALGTGFNECIKNSKNLTKEEINEKGINYSKTHIDFMIGSRDMLIEAECKDKKIVTIMKDGNIVL